MGRMLEALKRAEVVGAQEAVPPRSEEGPPLHIITVEEPEDEMPYIEVGGRGKPVDASPGILPVPARPQVAALADPVPPQHTAVPGVPACTVSALHPSLQSPPTWAPGLAERGPLHVAFQPCHLPRVPAGPRMAQELVAFHQPDHPVSRQYRSLLAQVAPGLEGAAGSVLLFSALAPAAGVTTALLNLAVCAAADGSEVVVVDANLKRPAVASRLGVVSAPGLREILAGTAALDQALRHTAQERLHALTAGGGVRESMLGAEAARWLAAWLKRRFDLVFVDGPTWDGGLDMAALVGASDRVLLVLDPEEAARPEVRAATRAIARMGGHLGGLLVTR